MSSGSIARRWRAPGSFLSAASGIAALAALAALAAAAPGAAGQAPAGTGVTLQHFHGSWELVEWIATNQRGETTHPYGENARGQITYSTDGRMSAHLMRPPEDPTDAPPQYLGYWGTFSLQAGAGTVTHHVMGTDMANWIGTDQVRRFRFESQDELVLSVGGQHLTWRRAGLTR